jgi:hypothetical protein
VPSRLNIADGTFPSPATDELKIKLLPETVVVGLPTMCGLAANATVSA